MNNEDFPDKQEMFDLLVRMARVPENHELSCGFWEWISDEVFQKTGTCDCRLKPYTEVE